MPLILEIQLKLFDRWKSALTIMLLISLTPLGATTWLGSYGGALKRANRDNTIVFLYFYADWCGTCRTLEENVYSQSKVIREIRRIAAVKIDGEKGQGKKLANQFKVKAYPTLLFLDKNGYILHKHTGGLDAAEFIQLSKDAFIKKNEGDEILLSAQSSKDPSDYFAAGVYLSKANQKAAAFEYFEKTYAQSTDLEIRLDGLFNMAVTTMEMGHYIDAEKYWTVYLTESKQSDSNRSTALLYRGISRRYNGKMHLAREDVKNAIPGLKEPLKNAASKFLKSIE